MVHISDLNILLRITCAIVCGAVVGWERERREKAAGLRTHIFVSMGSALIMVVSAFGFSDAVTPGLIMLDPSRVAAQVVTGIGFLGAGVIWFNRNKVRGLDTAAGIWTTSAVGLACGGGMYALAFMVTGAILLMNILLPPLEQILFPRRKYGKVLLTSQDSAPLDMNSIRQIISDYGIKIKAVRSTIGTESSTVGLDINGPKTTDWLKFVESMRTVSGISSVAFNEPDSDTD